MSRRDSPHVKDPRESNWQLIGVLDPGNRNSCQTQIVKQCPHSQFHFIQWRYDAYTRQHSVPTAPKMTVKTLLLSWSFNKPTVEILLRNKKYRPQFNLISWANLLMWLVIWFFFFFIFTALVISWTNEPVKWSSLVRRHRLLVALTYHMFAI